MKQDQGEQRAIVAATRTVRVIAGVGFVAAITMTAVGCGIEEAGINVTAVEASEATLGTCERDCMRDFMQCVRGCIGEGGCEAACEEEVLYCRGSCPNGDVDGDGVINSQDNCVFDWNAGQADCDGDNRGDVCDNFNGNYQRATSDATCMTDKDNHTFYFTFEHHVQWRERDVSSCGGPDRWKRRIRVDNDCFNISDRNCCLGLRNSITAVGDDPNYWCDAAIRNRDYCHAR